MDLVHLHHKQIAVVIHFPDGAPARLLCGESEVTTDEILGEYVKISFCDCETGESLEGDPCIILQDKQWTEKLSADNRHGRDYQLSLDARFAAGVLATQ